MKTYLAFLIGVLTLPSILLAQSSSNTSTSFETKMDALKATAQEEIDEFQEEVDDFFDEDLEDLLSTELVTITSREAQTVDEVPNIVTIITEDEIQQSGARSLGEVLSLIPGIHVKNTAPFTSFGSVHAEVFLMRGIMVGGTKHILFLLDGQRLNDSQTGGIERTLAAIPLHNVGRIEVIRGPGSARYGTSAFTGVVNIITRKGDELRGGEATTSIHSHGGFAHSLLLGNKRGPWTYSFNGFFLDDDGQRHELDTFEGSEAVRDGRTLSNAALHVQYNQAFFRYHQYKHDTDPFVLNGRANPEDDRLLFHKGTTSIATAGYEWLLPSGSLLIDLQYSRFTSEISGINTESIELLFPDEEDPLDTVGEGGGVQELFDDNLNRIISGSVADDIRVAVNLQWLHRFGTGHVFEFGVTSITETLVKSALTLNLKSFAGLGMGPPVISETKNLQELDLAKDRRRQIRGIYFQENYRVHSDVSIYFGARYDDYSDVGNTFNPRAGLVYRVTKQQVFKLLYGSAFRAPAFQEQFTVQENTANFVENDLDPERTQVTEVSYQYGISKIYKFKINAYRGSINDLIFSTERVDQENPQTLDNVIDLETLGMETEFRVEFRPSHYLHMNFSRMFVEFEVNGEEHRELNNLMVPQSMFNLVYNHPVGEWLNVNSSLSFRSKQELSSKEREDLSPFTLVNFHLIVSPPTFPTAKGFAGVRNLTDATYFSPSEGLNDLPEREREILAGIRVQF